MSLDGNIAIITGAGQGIGKEIALTLAKKGTAVVVSDISKIESEKVSDEIKSLGGSSFPAVVDVTNPQQVETMVQKTIKEYKKIDILVNNAGVVRDNLMMRMKKEDWDFVLNVNLTGAFNCTKAVSRSMMKQRMGKIINISSVVGVMGNAGQANYSASKAGLIGFTKSIAREFASRNITANAIAPGFIDTDMTRALPDEVKNLLLKDIPLKRFGLPQDIAECVCFLVSKKANYITGQVLNINGGMVM